MSEKISWTDLRRQISNRSGLSEKETGAFLSALTSQITNGLREDKQVRIVGLGTFRLQAVAPRKSVNVVTGEAITIEGYNKIVFNSESGVKELMQATSTAANAVSGAGAAGAAGAAANTEAINPLKKLGEQAEEIVDILAELGQIPHTAKQENEEIEQEEDVVQEETVEEETVPESPVEEEAKTETIGTETAETETETETTAVEEKEKEEEEEEQEEKEKPAEEKKPKYHFFRDLIITVFILLLLLGAGFYFMRNALTNWIESLGHQPIPIEVVQQPQTPIETSEEPAAEVVEKTEQVADTEEVTMNTVQEIRPNYDELLATEEMHQDSRLTWMAYRYYGQKDLWVFIYDANKDHIANPNNIKVGTPIRVPKLSEELRDINNPKTQALIEKLKKEFGD